MIKCCQTYRGRVGIWGKGGEGLTVEGKWSSKSSRGKTISFCFHHDMNKVIIGNNVPKDVLFKYMF